MDTILNLKLEVYSDVSFQENDEGKKIPHSYHAIFANAEDPVLEVEIPLSKMIEQFVENNVIPGGTVTEQQRHHVLSSLESIKALTEHYIKIVEQMPHPDQAKSKKKP
jgi:phosphoribosylformylglycinamidine (FGAM) synthase-like amidotransferase family enzyme